MTISESLIVLNSFPIPTLLIERIGLKRGLVVSDEATTEILITEPYRLGEADVYKWLSSHVDFSEQELSMSQQLEIKQGFLSMANAIYKELGDSEYVNNGTYGFKGENW